MSGVDETLAEVEDKLFRLSQGRVQKLTQLLEQAMHSAETRGMAMQSLDALRPRLKLDRPPRRPNLTRVMTQPFQGMLISDAHADRRRGKVRRTVLSPVWAVVEMQMDSALRIRLSGELAALPIEQMTLEQLDTEIDRIGKDLWPVAAAALKRLAQSAEASADFRSQLASALEADDRVDDLITIAGYLEIADSLHRLDLALRPIPIDEPSEEQILAIRSEVRHVAKKGGKAAYLVYFIMARYREPTVLIPVLDEMAQFDSGLPGMTLSDVARSAVLADFDDYLKDVRSRGRSAVSDTEVAQMSLDLLERAQRVAIDAGLGNDPGFKASFQETKQYLRGLVTQNVINGASDAILAGALPTDGAPSKEALLKAEARARALVRCAKAGVDLGIDGELALQIKGVSDSLEQRAGGLIQQLSAKSITEDEKQEARSTFNSAIRILEIVAGSAKAGALFRQARTAERK